MNRLRAVMSFAATGASGCAHFRAAQIFGARQFVWGVIDDFIWLQLRGSVGAQMGDFSRNVQQKQNCNELEDKRCTHAAPVKAAERSFSGETWRGARECGTDRRDELFPARRPLDQQLRFSAKLADDAAFELEHLGQAGIEFPWGYSPEMLFVRFGAPEGAPLKIVRLFQLPGGRVNHTARTPSN